MERKPEECRKECRCLSRIEDELFKAVLSPSEVAAIVLEPVQGEGGYLFPPDNYLPDLRALADRHGILIIADEIQTGMGRTGKMWACDHSGFVPDILLTSKGTRLRLAAGSHGGAGRGDELGTGNARLDVRRQPGRLRRGSCDH